MAAQSEEDVVLSGVAQNINENATCFFLSRAVNLICFSDSSKSEFEITLASRANMHLCTFCEIRAYEVI